MPPSVTSVPQAMRLTNRSWPAFTSGGRFGLERASHEREERAADTWLAIARRAHPGKV